MISWASSREMFPQSVHALMSLWGDFVPPTEGSDSGSQKRLELNFKQPIALDLIALVDLEKLMALQDEYLENSFLREGILGATFSQTLVILSPRQLIINSASSVMLHRLLQPLLHLLQTRDLCVEWVSFFCKNTESPWGSQSETSDIMAQEYADLKAAFPKGQSFITGPVDAEHYFHFIYDGIDRSASHVAETDAQVNVFLYNITRTEEDSSAIDKAAPSNAHRLDITGKYSYEMLRICRTGRHASFETNALDVILSPARMKALLQEFSPSRFAVVALKDKNINGISLRHTFNAFPGYSMLNCSVNSFSEEYSFYHFVFLRDE